MPPRRDLLPAARPGLTTELFTDLAVMGRTFRVEATFGAGDTVFGLRLGDLSLGDILRYMVGLAGGPADFKLEPPWSVLNEINLRNLEFTFNATQGKAGIVYQHLNLTLPFVSIDAIELWYGPKDATSRTRTLDVRLYGQLLDRKYPYPDQPLSWELLNQPAPAVPSGAPKTFDLDYLGLGQHVTLRDAAALTTMKAIIDGLVGSYAPVEDDANPLTRLPALKFDASAGWLIGVRLSVLDTVYLSVIFNDPNLYGLRVELAGERARIFAGLQFELLYRKVTDDIGVFHLELQLPDAMRHFELGAIAITLPVAVVDIYTNGDFLIDLGFPYNLDFTRAFTLQMFIGPIPVVGAGGLRFGVMSGLTSAEVPRITNGRFAPVLVFGFGLRLGVGKSVSLGVLSAGVLISLEGLLEGVLAFFEPEDASLPKSMFYRLHGMIRISAHIYGHINFVIIQAAVDIYAYASVSGTLQAHEPMVLAIEAGVSASLSVKILFFRVKLSFSATVRETITIGHATPPPWRVAAGAQAPVLVAGRALRVGAARAGDSDVRARLQGRRLAWQGRRVAHELRTLDLYLQPVVTVGRTEDYPPGHGAGAAADATAVQLVIELFVSLGNPDPARGAGFEELARAELLWAVATIDDQGRAPSRSAPPLPREVARSALALVMDDLSSPGARQPIGFCEIVDFLRENFRLRIRRMPADPQSRAAMAAEGLTLFPIPPYLTLEAGAEHHADFQTLNPCDPDYIATVEEYFRQLSVPVTGTEAGAAVSDAATSTVAVAIDGPLAPDSIAAFIFGDYFTMVLRQIVQASLGVFDGLVVTPPPETALEDLVTRYGVLGDDPVARIALANQDNAEFFADGTVLTFVGLLAQVRTGESLRTFAARVTVDPLALVTARKDVLGLLKVGASIAVPASGDQPAFTVTIGSGDTWASIATSPPTLADLVSEPANLDSTTLLATQFTFELPPVRLSVKAGPDATPSAIARRFDLDVVDVVRAAAASSPHAVGTVRLPAFERLPVEELFATLRERDAFAAAAATVARCLMGGLRLPDPRNGWQSAESATLARGAAPWSGLRLYPLAVLMGQQWLAPPALAAGYTMTLAKNPLADRVECQRPAIEFDSDHPDHDITIALSAEDLALAQAYAGLATRSDGPFDPALLTSARLAPFAVFGRRYGLGTGRPWASPQALPLGESDQCLGLPLLFALPDALREQLGRSPAGAPDLRLMTGPPGVPGAPAPEARAIAARAWATRVRFSLTRVESARTAKAYIPGVYCVFGSDLDGPRLLRQVIDALEADASIAPRLDILYSASATDPLQAAVQSDHLDADRVLLVKANLSTETRPPRVAIAPGLFGAGIGEVSHATLADPLAFLRLFWQACITNAGGFHLLYHIGDGEALPPQLFNQSPSAPIELLITWLDAATGKPAAARPFHNVVVCAENLGAGSPNVFVAPPQLAAGEGATFGSLARALGTTVEDLAAANATRPEVVRPGIRIALPTSGAYTVQVGDTLLDIALREPTPSVALVAQQVDAAERPLLAGAALHVHTGWVYRRPVVPPGVVGFRVLRTDPAPESTDGRSGAAAADEPPGTRLQTLFNLLSYRLAASDAFRASPFGLPVAPAQDPHPSSATATAAWRYSRMLGIEPYAIGRPSSTAPAPSGPYVGIGQSAVLAFDLYDVFGNRSLPPDRLPRLEVPIRYSDPVYPISQWPSVSGTFDFAGPGQVVTSLTFDAGRYMPATDGTLASAMARITADRELVARIETQLQQPDVQVTVSTTFALVDQRLEKGPLLALLHDIHRYLGTVSTLEPVVHVVAPGDDLRTIARRFHVPVGTLAAVNADDASILASGSEYVVPRLHIVSRADTLGSICERAGGTLTPAMLAKRNRKIPLEPGVTLLLGGRSVVATAGDTLQHLLESSGGTWEAIGRENAAVPDLFAPGTQVLLSSSRESVAEGSTLAELARWHEIGLSDLAAANAREAALLRQGASVQIPEHVALGTDRAATYQVRAGDSLQSVGNFLRVSPGALALANLDVDVLRAAQPTGMSYRLPGATDAIVEQVRERDTFATILRRFRSHPGCAELSIGDLAEQNQASAALLNPGAWMLAPPEDVIETFTPGFRPPGPIFPVTITLRIERDLDLVDPALVTDPGVRAAATDLPPHLTGTRSGGEAVSLQALARRFERAFPGLRLATAAGAPPDQAATRPLTAVSCPDAISYAIEQSAHFFAPRPLSNRLWSSAPACPVPVPEYADGKVTGATNTACSGVDLDSWGRDFVAAVDRLLSPEYGIAVCHVLDAGADYDRIVAAKGALARAIGQQVVPLVDPPPRAKPPDIEAAREALHQRLLVELSSAYDVDAIVQFRVAVKSPYTSASTAPRLGGRVEAVSLAIPEGATLLGLARRYDAPLATLAAVAADIPYLLEPGFTVRLSPGGSHVVESGDTLSAVAAAVGVSLDAFVDAYATESRLLHAGADLGLITERRRARSDDTLGTLIDALARGTPITASMPIFLGMNGGAPRLLAPGAEIGIDAKRHRVASGETFEDVARLLEVPALTLLERLLDRPGLIADRAEVKYLARLQGFSLSTGKIALVNGDSSLTMLVDLATTTAMTSVGVDLQYSVAEIEYDIDAPATGSGYQQSQWLSLVEPMRHDNLPRIDIPVALRSYPTPPVLLSQSTQQSIPDHPTLDQIKAYDFVYTYACSPAAQDQVRTDVETNVVDGGLLQMAGDPGDTLPYWLARYIAIGPALWRDLGPLADPEALAGSPQLADAARGAVGVFAQYAGEIARAWEAWTDGGAPAVRAASDARFMVQYRAQGGGHAGISVEEGADPSSGPRIGIPTLPKRALGPAAVPVAVAGPGQRAGRTLAAAAPAAAAAGPPTDLVLTHRVPSLDVLDVQNIRGFVDVERNRDLLPDRATRPEFVYAVDRVRAAGLVWPLVTHREPCDMTAVPPLRSWPDPRTPRHRLADFFAALLEVAPDSPPSDGHPVRIGLAFLHPLNDAERARLLGDGSAPSLLCEIPIALQGVADFVPARDLLGDDGLCAQLAQRMEGWASENPAIVDSRAGCFTFDITVYSNLSEGTKSSGSRPLLSLSSVRLPLTQVDLASPAAGGQVPS